MLSCCLVLQVSHTDRNMLIKKFYSGTELQVIYLPEISSSYHFMYRLDGVKVGHLELFVNAALFSLSDLHKCDAVGGETGQVSMLTC